MNYELHLPVFLLTYRFSHLLHRKDFPLRFLFGNLRSSFMIMNGTAVPLRSSYESLANQNLPSKICNCLKISGTFMILDCLSNCHNDVMKNEYFYQDVKQMSPHAGKYFAIYVTPTALFCCLIQDKIPLAI